MKRLCLCFLLVITTLSCLAQQKVGTYHSSYFNREYDIRASYAKDGDINLYIQVTGAYDSDDVNFSLRGKSKIESFINALTKMKAKFLEWDKVAKDNKVTDMSKDFDVDLPDINIAWHSTKWWFAFAQELHPKFIVFSDGKSIATIAGVAEASDNEYITQKYYFALNKAAEFDELIKAITPATIKSQLDQKKEAQDLFK